MNIANASQSSTEIVSAYRALLRTSYRAVRYARPARNILRDRMRRAFRESLPEDFEAQRIRNTVQFFERAGRDTGMEHKVLKSLIKSWSGEVDAWRNRQRTKSKRKQAISEREDGIVRSYDAFYECIRGLNQTMGLCIR
jgi:hypothetical protein